MYRLNNLKNLIYIYIYIFLSIYRVMNSNLKTGKTAEKVFSSLM